MIDNELNDLKPILTKENYIIGYTIKDFEYRTPTIIIDDHGEPQITYTDDLIRFDIVTLLQRHTKQNNQLIAVDSIDAANTFILNKKINDDAISLSTYSSALIHYFNFLEVNGLQWNKIPSRNNQKPTYRYKNHLKASYISQETDEHLARSTCNSYIRVITNFYKFHIRNRYIFENKPFENEVLLIQIKSDHSNMRSTHKHEVHTTDLRLELGRDRRNDGTARRLIPLSDNEWKVVSDILQKDRKISKVINGIETVAKLDIDSAFMFLFERYTGMRREEILTLRTRHVRMPTQGDKELGYCPVEIGPQNNSKTKNSTDRTIHFPISLMYEFYRYLNSARHITKKNKYLSMIAENQKLIVDYNLAKNTPSLTPENLALLKTKAKSATTFLAKISIPTEAYIFLNYSGKPYGKSSSNARWSEIRNTASKILGYHFDHKPHNLRSTYAVDTLKRLIALNIRVDRAVDYIQARLGHRDTATTMIYLRFAQNEMKGHEVFERTLDFMFNNDQVNMGEF